VLKVIPENLKE